MRLGFILVCLALPALLLFDATLPRGWGQPTIFPAFQQPPAPAGPSAPPASSPATQPADSQPADFPPPSQEEETGEAAPTAPAARQSQGREEIEQQIARLKDLALSGAEMEQATRFLQDALQATTEIERFEAERAQWDVEYRPQTDPDDPDGPQEFTPGWYEKRLELDPPFVKAPQVSDLEADPLATLSERATRLEGYANKWNETVQQLEGAPAARKQWLNALPARTLEIQQQLDSLRETIARIDQEGISNPVTAARRTWLVEREARFQAELAANEARKLAIERAEALYPLELELARRKLAFYRNELAAVREGISVRRQREANEQAQGAQQQLDAHRDLVEKYPESVGEVAEKNRQLTAEGQKLSASIDETIANRTATNELLQQLRSRFQTIEAQFEDQQRLSQASGQVLRDERNRLPSVPRLLAEIDRATVARNDITFRRFEANESLASLKDLDQQVARLTRDVAPPDHARAVEAVKSMLIRQREHLEGIERNLNHLESELAALVVTKKALLDVTTEFRAFIARRDLWIRSSRPLHEFQSPHFLGALRWSLRGDNWRLAGERLIEGVAQRPNRAIALATVFVLLLLAQREGRRQLEAAGHEAEKKTCIAFFPTIRALGLTLLVALPWPLLLWGLGWLIGRPLMEGEFPRALAVALQVSAWCLLVTELLRTFCRHDGLADAHLNWSRASLAMSQRWLRWIPFTLIPLIFWSVLLGTQTTQPLWSASLGRVLTILGMAIAAVAIWRILFVKSSPIYQALLREPRGWLARAFPIWRLLLLATPCALIILSWLGYDYTAQQLTSRVLMSLGLLLALVVTGGLFKRGILLNRRKLAREQARQRRAQAIAAAEAAAAAASDGEGIPPLVIPEYTDEVADLSALSEQSRKLLQMILFLVGVAGAILIWQNIFPALAWLDGRPMPWVPQGTDDPTSWGDVLRALIAVVVSYVVVRDVPGLLELLVLQHLPIDQGARYAISTLVRYALLIIGIIVAANLMGITGTSISWLVAAMGVGLGFGLQEIFANFVSGIILLFERPIRVGDVISLGDKTGVVSRIRMRATTITDGDRKEYIVPNKHLVTERLLNWTLSDRVNRIVVLVEVAQGSDTELACQLLREAADECPAVLKDPPPMAMFEKFGPSSYSLALRCFLPDMDKRGETTHRLHTLIGQKFYEAGILLGKPQIGVSVEGVPTLQMVTLSEATSNGAPTEAREPERLQ